MKIKATKNKEKVSDIVAGTIFEYDKGEVYMKTRKIDTQYGFINAVVLNSGIFAFISEDDLVTVYPDAELTL